MSEETDETELYVLIQDDETCWYCGAPMCPECGLCMGLNWIGCEAEYWCECEY